LTGAPGKPPRGLIIMKSQQRNMLDEFNDVNNSSRSTMITLTAFQTQRFAVFVTDSSFESIY